MEKWEKFSKEELSEIIKTSKSFAEIAQHLGYSGCNGQLIKKIRNIASQLEINTPLLEKKVHKAEDYVGEIHNYLKINKIDKQKTEQEGITYFDCTCLRCGKVHHLVSIVDINKTKSCGCLRTEHFVEGHYENLEGQTFQHFKVLSLNKEMSLQKGKTYWNCLCTKCNKNIIPVWMWDLKAARRDNCGCYNVKSRGEERLNHCLTELNIKFIPEYSFEDFYTTKGHCYRYDFAIFDNNQLKCLIEYHGKQHYKDGWKDKESLENIQARDQLKEQYCKNNNIPLIVIPYTDFEKINTQYLLNKLKEVL